MIKTNRGSTVIEATLILPLFIFAMLSFYCMGRLKTAEQIILEAAYETIEYMSEYAYLEAGSVYLPELVFSNYIDNKELAEQYIEGGISGVNFFGTLPEDEDGYITLVMSYTKQLSLPFIPQLSSNETIVLRQKVYRGYQELHETDDLTDDDIYVYVTDNADVYHRSRSCSHITLNINLSGTLEAIEHNYRVCEMCGNSAGAICFITEDGNCLHSTLECSGLKRTVKRVKLSDVSGLGECSRCGY